jgi:alpha-tubulin suppressor-like RCC1 family protein
MVVSGSAYATEPVGTPSSDVVVVANEFAGGHHNCALKNDGSIACWGWDEIGQVSNAPTGQNFIQVSAGGYHNCALKNDGSIVCWGWNQYGQVGMTPSGNDFTQVSAGTAYNCALKDNGSIVCWGSGSNGQTFPPSSNDFTQISAGVHHTCALSNDGSIACWGWDLYGQVSKTPSGDDFTQVSANYFHTCALRRNGGMTCWGKEDIGQITDAPTSNDFTQISAGIEAGHSCALKNDGRIRCWGQDLYGLVSNVPTGKYFTQVNVGQYHTCALKNDGSIICWGSDWAGQVSSTGGNDFVGSYLAIPGDDETCLIYALHDEGLNDTQFFTINPNKDFEVNALGDTHLGYDIEGMDIHPQTGKLYASSGDEAAAGLERSYLYQVNKNDGTLTLVCSTGLGDVSAMSFHPQNHTLWVWADGQGLFIIDINKINNGICQKTEKVLQSTKVEGLAWGLEGKILYGNEGTALYKYFYETGAVVKACDGFPSQAEALDMLADGSLLFGLHHAGDTNIHSFDIDTCSVKNSVPLPIETPYTDIEGITWKCP